MKKIIIVFTTLLSLLTASANAQITLDTIVQTSGFYVGYNFKTVQISATETKYFYADTVTNTFNLYNMDWTPFMTNIAVPVPFNNFTYQCLYITRELFDCDPSNIEYLYTAPNGAIDRKLYVMRTDGTQLLKLDSAFCEYCYGGCLGGSDLVRPIVNTSSGAKMFVVKNPLSSDISIYSLCGTLPTDIFDFSSAEKLFVKVFPNPTTDVLTFQISAPDNINDFELVLLDNNAKELNRQKLNTSKGEYKIDVSNLSSGTYYYSLCTKSKAYQSGKFVITK